ANTAPVAADQALTLAEDTSLAITLHATDADNDPLSYTVTGSPSHGSLSGTAPALTYTPNLHYHGADSFTFVVNDGTVDSNVATVVLTVAPVNDTPVAEPQTLTLAEDTSLELVLVATDTETDSLTYEVVVAP